MNNLIRDMALDVMVKYVNDGEGWGFSTEELDKLGEMIVKECVKICDADYNRCGQEGAGWRLAREIEDHFGVET